MAPQPDAKHLLELLKRAADELKASQGEVKSLQSKLVEAEVALAEERRQRQELSQQLLDTTSGGMTLPPGPMRAEFTNKTVAMGRSPLANTTPGGSAAVRPREEKTSVTNDDPGLLTARMVGLQDELAQLDAERRVLKGNIL